MPRKSFTVARSTEPVTFDIDGDVFEAVPAGSLPGGALLDLASLDDKPKTAHLRAIVDFLDTVLLPESAERFAARLRDASNPITIDTAADVCVWLVEEVYTGHPTRQSPQLAGGLSTTGDSSTGGA